ncbi:MAG: glycosyltransferase family 9 protein, partial [Holophagae bacterium]
AIAVGLVERGLQTVVAWGPAEAERASRVAELAGSGTDTAPPTDLVELAALLRAARLVVGGDTGPVHLAASLGTPTVGVFLTTDPDRNGPLGPATAVVSGAARHAAPTGSATTRALRSVGVDEVLAAVDRLLQRHE